MILPCRPITVIAGLLMSAWLLPASQTIHIDGRRVGRTFEGIGALSAGASSKLLIDYPEPQRSQILDLLFKPKWGAGLQHLKVEIGGDVNSTCGTEPAYAHTREEFDNIQPAYLERGYETWLMQEAKKRSPAVLFESLQWGAPGWIGSGQFYSQDNADYIARFHKALREHLGLELSYQGIWNETPYDIAWIKTLRRTLDRQGLADVRIAAADQTGNMTWRIVDDLKADAELAAAVHAIGDHYLAFESPAISQELGKPLWAAEDGPWAGDWAGFTKLAKFYNRSYIEGRITRFITWSLVTSYYDILPLPGSGLMRANEPWSGHFEMQPGLWAAAHTTQFAEPGWVYIDSGCGSLERYGSYVTLRSPDGGDYTIVAETMDSPYLVIGPRQEVEFHLSDDFPEKPVHVWKTGRRAEFVKVATIHPEERTFRVVLDGESLYTLSTTSGQRKGGADVKVPPAAPLPLPYKEDFDDYDLYRLPKYFIDQSGAFEIAERPEGAGRCLRQMAPGKGIEWHFHGNPEPYTLMGDERWEDYEVEVEARFDGAGWVAVYGRTTRVDQKSGLTEGYWATVSSGGRWELKKQTDVIASGQAELAASEWQRIGLRFESDRITVLINGVEQGGATDGTYRHGLAGLGCDWQLAWFDNFTVRPLAK